MVETVAKPVNVVVETMSIADVEMVNAVDVVTVNAVDVVVTASIADVVTENVEVAVNAAHTAVGVVTTSPAKTTMVSSPRQVRSPSLEEATSEVVAAEATAESSAVDAVTEVVTGIARTVAETAVVVEDPRPWMVETVELQLKLRQQETITKEHKSE